MADRILTWYIEEPKGDGTQQGTTFCLDRDYMPVCVRAYAGTPPDADELSIDLLNDGVSILTNKAQLQANQNLLDWFEDINEVVMNKYSIVTLNLVANGAKKITVMLELEVSETQDEEPV